MNDFDLTDMDAQDARSPHADLIWRTLRKRWWLILILATVFGAAGLAFSLSFVFWPDSPIASLWPPLYTAQGKILIEAGAMPLAPEANDLINPYNDRTGRQFFQTRLVIMRSSETMIDVMGRLEGKPYVQGRELRDFLKDFTIDINAERGTNIAVVTVSSHEPDYALDVAQTVIDVAKEADEKDRKKSISNAIKTLTEEIDTIDIDLKEEEDRLRKYNSSQDLGTSIEQEQTLQRILQLRSDKERTQRMTRQRMVALLHEMEATATTLKSDFERKNEKDGKPKDPESQKTISTLDTIKGSLAGTVKALDKDIVNDDIFKSVQRHKDELLDILREEKDTVETMLLSGGGDDGDTDKESQIDRDYQYAVL